MFNFLGITQNLSAVESQPWMVQLNFREANSEPSHIFDGLTFEGYVITEQGRIDMSVEHGEEAGSIIVRCPALMEGRHRYAIGVIDESVEYTSLVSGYIGVVRSHAKSDEVRAYAIPAADLILPRHTNDRIRVTWVSSSYAVAAANNAEQSAKDAAASAGQAASSATQAAVSATDAQHTLDNLNATIQQAIEEATRRAEAAASNAEQSVLQAGTILAECQAVRNQTQSLLEQSQYVLTQCRAVYSEILALIETGAVGDAITAATGNILEQMLTDERLTRRFVAAMAGSGAFVLVANLGRGLTFNPLGMLDVDLSNYTGSSISLTASGNVTIKSSTTASLTLSAGAAALYGGTSASITHTNDNKITLYNYGGSTGNVCSIVSNRIDGRGITGIQLRISATESGSNAPSFSMHSSSTSFYHPTKNTASPAFSLT